MSMFTAKAIRTLGQAASLGIGGLGQMTPAPAHPQIPRGRAASPAARKQPAMYGGAPPCTPCAASAMIRDSRKNFLR